MIAVLVFIPRFLKQRALKNDSESPQANAYMPQELGHSFAALIIGFLFCTAAIFIYYLVAPDTLVWFSVTAVFWYLFGYTAYALQKIMKERKNSEKQ